MLYINQLVSSSLAWSHMGVAIGMAADMYAPGPSAVATIGVDIHSGSSSTGADFRMRLRIPSWCDASRTQLLLNGKPWSGCPGMPAAGRYCEVRGALKQGHASFSVVSA